MKKDYKIKKQLITLSLLCFTVVGMSQKLSIIREYVTTKTVVDFGDIDIEATKSDTFYIKASEGNNSNVSVTVVFDEDRTANCPYSLGPVGFLTKNIFEVFVDSVELVSANEIISFPIQEDAKGSIILSIAPGDSSMVVVNATPANHNKQEVPEGGDDFNDCVFGSNPQYSLGLQSDEIVITNSSTNIGSHTIPLSFNGIEETTTPTGLFDLEDESKQLEVYPNPATALIKTEVGQLEILDLTGNLVLSTTSNGQVDVSSLGSGVYLVTQNGKRTKLIIE